MFSLLLCGGVIMIFSLVLNSEELLGPLGGDKLNHFIAYAVFTILLVWTLSTRQQGVTFYILIAAWAISFSFGLLLEAMQPLITAGRHWENADLLANGLGASVPCLFLSAVCMHHNSIDLQKKL